MKNLFYAEHRPTKREIHFWSEFSTWRALTLAIDEKLATNFTFFSLNFSYLLQITIFSVRQDFKLCKKHYLRIFSINPHENLEKYEATKHTLHFAQTRFTSFGRLPWWRLRAYAPLVKHENHSKLTKIPPGIVKILLKSRFKYESLYN